MVESNLGKIKSTFKLPSLTRSLMSLFVIKKGVNPHTRYPDAYYGRIAFDKRLFQGIELVAKIERTTKKHAAEELMKAGLSSYMGEKLTQYIESERAAREFHQKMQYNRFIYIIRQYARERGYDISKFL